jgi:hypothetical protein
MSKKKSLTQKKSHSKYIGIDPGKGGGIAVIDDGKMKAYKCPNTVEDMAILFSLMVNGTAANKILVGIERVWARPTNGSRHSFAYGTNYGEWLGIIACHELIPTLILPLTWMKHVGCQKGLKVEVRKRWLKDKAIESYPELKKVTLATADAILITKYIKESV